MKAGRAIKLPCGRQEGPGAPQRQSRLCRLRDMLDLLHSLFTLSGAAVAVAVLIVAVVIWRYRNLD